MDNWPPTITHDSTKGEKRRKGKIKTFISPYPLLEGGALTSAALRQVGNRFEWIPAQSRTFNRRLVCSENAVLAFPATRSPPLRSRTSPSVQRAEKGAQFLREYYPDVDVPAELIREQVGAEAQLEDSLRGFDPLVSDLIASIHISDGSKKPWSFVAFPMGESGCDLNFSNIEFSAEGDIVTEPSHCPAKTFETPICQLSSSPLSNLSGTSSNINGGSLSSGAETVIAVRTFSSTSLFTLSLPTFKKSKKTTFIDIKEIGSFDRSNLNGYMGVDVRIHSSSGYAALVNDRGHIFRHKLLHDANPIQVYEGASDLDNPNDNFWRIALGAHDETCFLMSSKSVQHVDFRTAERGIQVYSVTRAPDLLTSIGHDLGDGLLRLVTTNELMWIDPRFHIRPMLASKHEREYDRTLTSHAVGIRNSKTTVLSSRNNCLLSVYDVSGDETSLIQSHALPYNLPCRFPGGPHSGFYVIDPHPESDNVNTASLLQLTSRGRIYQSALSLCQDQTQSSSPARMDISWSPAIYQLDAASPIQQPYVGKLGARATQEVDFRQAYQCLFSPLDATEAVHPPENADAVYQTLDAMPLFWQQSNTAYEHLLTTFDIAFRSGEEPTHASRADFLTQSTLNSRRGFRALVQGRVPQETLVEGAAWHLNLEPILKKFVPDVSGDIQLTAQRLCKYDLIVDDYRSGSSLRRESEAREELAVDLALSTDVFSAHSFAKAEPEITDDDLFETMSRAAEAMTLSDTVAPSVHFGYLTPIPTTMDHGTMDAAETEPGLELPLGVRLLLGEWDTSIHPDQYTYHDPYDDQQPAATSPMFHASIRKRGGREQAQTMRPPAVLTTAPVIARSREIPISNSQPGPRRDTTEASNPHPDSQAPLLASTQIESGPFGGRPLTGRKKAVPGKKRMMGF